MKYVTATLGSLFVAFGALVAILAVPVVVYPAIYHTITGLAIMYAVAIPLALLAGYLSFRATLKVYSTEQPASQSPRSTQS
jgi:hypothetical protein